MFTHPTDQGGLFNVNWFQVYGKGAAASAPPNVSATADRTTGQAPLTVKFNATATDPEGEALTYLWDFGVTGHDDRHVDAGGPDLHLRQRRYLQREGHRDRRGGHQGLGDGHRGRHQRAEPVQPERQVGRVQRHRRWTPTAGASARSANNFQVANGRLELPIDNGSIYQNGTSAVNIITQPVPTAASGR